MESSVSAGKEDGKNNSIASKIENSNNALSLIDTGIGLIDKFQSWFGDVRIKGKLKPEDQTEGVIQTLPNMTTPQSLDFFLLHGTQYIVYPPNGHKCLQIDPVAPEKTAGLRWQYLETKDGIMWGSIKHLNDDKY